MADADAFAARLGAKLVSAGSPPEPRTYRLPGFQLFVALNDAAAGEPTWGMNTTAGSGTNRPYTEDAARQAADAELAKRRAMWKKPAPRYTRGVLAKFLNCASSASTGAVLDKF